MENRIVTLTTDFGEGHYAAQMKAVILSMVRDATIVDIAHNVTPQCIKEGAYLLRSTAPWFPCEPKPVHICVVDPTVGSKRKPICIETWGGILVGPDNGVLYPAAERLGITDVFEITHEEIPKNISNVFHGRDVFARAGGMLLKGYAPSELGLRLDEIVELDLNDAIVNDAEDICKIECSVLHIDRFGNTIISLSKDMFEALIAKYGSNSVALIEGGRRFPLRRTERYCDVPSGTLIIIESSSGEMEISVREGSAAKELEMAVGRTVELELSLGL